MIRRASALVLAAVLAGTLMVVGGLSHPAGAATVGYELDMIDEGGVLTIRDADPLALEVPTTIAGSADDATGDLTVTAFSTPTISFERPVTGIIEGTAFIDAVFSPVGPGTGSVDAEGNVVMNQALTVNLHVEVFQTGSSTPIPLPGDCVSTPVNLELRSAADAPYDPDTDRVTLTDPDFTVPALEVNQDECDALIRERIDAELAGPGHSISLTMEGELPLPEAAACDTTTGLVVDPATTAPVGSELELTATVAPVAADPECVEAAEIPVAGTVEFSADGDVVGSATVDGSGVATLVTADLGAGDQDLTARYRGNETYRSSTSAAIAFVVTAPPAITTDLPGFIEIGSGFHEFDVTFNPSDFSTPSEDVRLDLTMSRNPLFQPDMVTVEAFVDDAWTPVPLTGVFGGLTIIGSVPGIDIAADTETTVRLRASFGAPNTGTPEAGLVTMTFEVVASDAPTGPAPAEGAVIRGTATTTLVPAERAAPTFTLGVLGQPPIQPHTVRQGSSVVITAGRIQPNVSNPLPAYIEVFLDGVQVDIARVPTEALNDVRRVNFTATATPSVMFQLPPGTPTGTRQVTVRYSGNAMFQPAQVVTPITVVPGTGAVYECIGASPMRFRASIVAQGNLPGSAPAGADIDIDHLRVRLLTDRSTSTTNLFSGILADNATTEVGSEFLEGIGFGFGPGGEGSATSVARSFGTRIPNSPNPGTDVDHILDPLGETGVAQIEGEVGDLVPVTLDTVTLDLVSTFGGLLKYHVVCEPVGDPALLGEVRVAGVDLSVAPVGTTREGDDVVLTAALGHEGAAGVVEFRDGDTTLGLRAVTTPTVTFTTDDLAVGPHSLTARYFPQPATYVIVSDAVSHTVLPEFDCPTFAEEGAGAVVRLMYMSLLERCPDQPGYDYWVAQLENGVTADRFAFQTSVTKEAQNLLIDRGYDTMLDRVPSDGDRDFWRGWLRKYKQYPKFLTALAASDEFLELAGGTRATFVERLFDRMLERDPSPGESDYWTGQLLLGSTRGTVAGKVAVSPEALGVLVDRAFADVLGTAPGATERANAVTALKASGNLTALYAKLVADPRFAARAAGFPNFPS